MIFFKVVNDQIIIQRSYYGFIISKNFEARAFPENKDKFTKSDI